MFFFLTFYNLFITKSLSVRPFGIHADYEFVAKLAATDQHLRSTAQNSPTVLYIPFKNIYNPLSTDINMYILLTALHMFP